MPTSHGGTFTATLFGHLGEDGRTLLAIPAKVRGTLGDGDRVKIELRFTL